MYGNLSTDNPQNESGGELAAAAPRQPVATAVLGIGLFILLAGVYLLSYSGIYHSGDEISYVRDAVEILRDTPLRWGRSGPFAVVLAVGVALTQEAGGLGSLQPLFLLNVVSSALAAVFVLLLGIRLGYDRRAALFVALLFGLATPAWVYSKMLFRDPFVAAALIAMAYFLIQFRYTTSLAALGLGVLSGAVAIGSRVSVAIVAPFALAYVIHVFWSRYQVSRARSRASKIAVYVVVGLLILLVAGVVIIVFALYTKWLDRLLRFFEHWDALLGLLISPGRGLLFFAPVILLALAGLLRFARRHPWETLLLYGPIPLYLLMVSAHPMWWGGWNWGPRYLVPFLPFLIFPTIALIDPLMVQRSRRWLFVPLVLIVLLSVVTQLVGASVGPNSPSFQNMEPSTFYNWVYAPLAYLSRLGDLNPDLAWLHLSNGFSGQIATVGPALAVLALGIILIWTALARKTGRGLLVAALFALTLAAVVAAWSLNQYYRFDARYKSPAGYPAALQQVVAQSRPGDALVYHFPEVDDVNIYSSLVDNFCRGKCPPPVEVRWKDWKVLDDESKMRWLYRLRGTYDRIWLLPQPSLAPEDLDKEVKPWLDTYLYKASCEQFGEDTTLCLYYNLIEGKDVSTFCYSRVDLPLESPSYQLFLPLTSLKVDVDEEAPSRNCPAILNPSSATFGGKIELQDVRLLWLTPPGASGAAAEQPATASAAQPAGPVQVAAGEALLIDLAWQALAPLDRQYNMSLQLLNQAGQLSHQLDRQPLDGLRPMTTWQQGEWLPDRLAFALPSTLPAGQYQLVLILYDSQSGERLPVPVGASTAPGAADALDLATVQIVAPADDTGAAR